MIIPISNGRTVTPFYISQPVTSANSGVLEQSYTNVQNDEPTLGAWIALGVVAIFLIVVVVYSIKLLKDFFGGEE